MYPIVQKGAVEVTYMPCVQTDTDSWECVARGNATVATAVQRAVVTIGVPPQGFRKDTVSSREIREVIPSVQRKQARHR